MNGCQCSIDYTLLIQVPKISLIEGNEYICKNCKSRYIFPITYSSLVQSIYNFEDHYINYIRTSMSSCLLNI